MKNEVAEVKHKGKTVGTVEVPIFENLDELRASVAEDKIVKLFNKMNKIELQANERNKHSTEKGGKKLKRDVAFNIVASDERLRQQLMRCTTTEQLDELLFSEDVQALVEKKLASD